MFKSLVIIASLLLSIHSYSQNLECCKTISEVKKSIAGDWKLKGDSKNVVYRFSFSKSKGFIEVLKEMNLPPKAEKTRENDVIINDHEIFNIQSKQGQYFIQIQSLYYEIKEKILVLNDTNFIYGNGDFKHVFIRDKS